MRNLSDLRSENGKIPRWTHNLVVLTVSRLHLVRRRVMSASELGQSVMSKKERLTEVVKSIRRALKNEDIRPKNSEQA